MVEIRTPILPDGINDAKIIAINYAVGERVEAQQCLFEIETEKVVLEIVAPEDGVVQSIEVAVDDYVVKEQLLANINTDEDSYQEDVEHVQAELNKPLHEQEEGLNTPPSKNDTSTDSPKVGVKNRDKWIVVASTLFIILCLLLLI